MKSRSNSLHGVSSALEFHLLRRACADGTPEHVMTAEVPDALAALQLLCAAGRLKKETTGYVLTYAGEYRLDELFEEREHGSEDLTARVLRLLTTISELDVNQIARALGVKSSSVTRSTANLLHKGQLARRPKPSTGHRGRTGYVYGLVAY